MKPRERLTSSLSLQGMNVTVYTLEAVKTVFVELFYTPERSMENPSLRVSGQGSSMNRTFIVEECAEDESGRWALDEVTGEHGALTMRDQVFRTWVDNGYAWQSRPFNGRQVKRRKGQGKRTGKSGFKRTETAFRGEEQVQDLEWWSEEDFPW